MTPNYILPLRWHLDVLTPQNSTWGEMYLSYAHPNQSRSIDLLLTEILQRKVFEFTIALCISIIRMIREIWNYEEYYIAFSLGRSNVMVRLSWENSGRTLVPYGSALMLRAISCFTNGRLKTGLKPELNARMLRNSVKLVKHNFGSSD
jgi:hypothetical protein